VYALEKIKTKPVVKDIRCWTKHRCDPKAKNAISVPRSRPNRWSKQDREVFVEYAGEKAKEGTQALVRETGRQ
jgi:hypothetical protein